MFALASVAVERKGSEKCKKAHVNNGSSGVWLCRHRHMDPTSNIEHQSNVIGAILEVVVSVF
jgi:ribosomal protein L37AE/L43A